MGSKKRQQTINKRNRERAARRRQLQETAVDVPGDGGHANQDCCKIEVIHGPMVSRVVSAG